MRFWDTSAVVPLLVHEPFTTQMASALESDREVVVWWGTVVECEAALRRRARDGSLDRVALSEARARLGGWQAEWAEIEPRPELRDAAARLLAVHPLRAADALQLAAALDAADVGRASLPFVCLDRRLADAASREGLTVVSIP
jgi:predicted nucleic acid-binding protein